MFADIDLLPVSALTHFVYCPRRCALVHLEQQWSENLFTAEGSAQHDRVDRPEHETRNGIRLEYATPLRSLQLGLIGKADVIEFHPDKIFPVEHKRGKPRPTHCDWVQLCAQAICLEEMLGVEIKNGAIFYGQPRRRQAVEFTPELRAETIATAQALHQMLADGKTPSAQYEKGKCEACSLFETCMPQSKKSVEKYIQTAFD